MFFVFQKCAKYSKRLLLIINITPRSCQGYFGSFEGQNCNKQWKYPLLINLNNTSGAVIYYKGLVLTQSWSDIFSTRFLGDLGLYLTWEGEYTLSIPLTTPLPECLIVRAKLESAAAVKYQFGLPWQTIDA